jgi:hypothetical protein
MVDNIRTRAHLATDPRSAEGFICRHRSYVSLNLWKKTRFSYLRLFSIEVVEKSKS